MKLQSNRFFFIEDRIRPKLNTCMNCSTQTLLNPWLLLYNLSEMREWAHERWVNERMSDVWMSAWAMSEWAHERWVNERMSNEWMSAWAMREWANSQPCKNGVANLFVFAKIFDRKSSKFKPLRLKGTLSQDFLPRFELEPIWTDKSGVANVCVFAKIFNHKIRK